KFVWFYATIGLFVLLLACINFMNLSTARSERRAREVGVRKTMGSARLQLIAQFYCESMLTTLLAFAIAILLVQLLLPWFDGVSAKTIQLPWTSPWFWTAGLAFTLGTGLMAGSYPALYLSSFRPVKVLKGIFRAGRNATLPRKVLVVFQFTVSIALIIGTLVVYRQVQYAKDRPVGYTRAGLIQIQMTSPDFQGKYDVLTNALRGTGVVSSMTESSQSVTGTWSNTGGIEWPGKDPSAESDFAVVRVTPEFAKTVGLDFTGGRDFSRAFPTDSNGLIINEAATRYMHLDQPVEQSVRWENDYEGVHKSFRILGVVRDVVANSPFEPVKQTIYTLRLDQPGWITLRINPQTSAAVALPKIAAVFHRLIPSAPFDYTFVDDQYATKFAAEERVGTLAGFFALLAVLISCLGLFGLATYVAEQRTKEIGVRKVLGATVADIWGMLSADFVKLTLLSCLVATPLAYVLMHRWLEQYAYRTSVSGWMLGLVSLGALALTITTVSLQAVRAARRKPVASLRSE
ncbi:MAG TPA: FtsX-like permease family protein, partial [Dinghuibacter sp.]|uniref:FtsX-like permease family protein n=1 Tax=Dinghuibacter sp. TaxID=2024697 RepID=UPI002CB6F62A